MGMTILGVAGGSGSGKTTFVKRLMELLDEECVLIAQDNYYHDQSDKFDHDGGSVNFDHPESLDFKLMREHLVDLKKGQPIQSPRYDFATHTRSELFDTLHPERLIIIDGILIFSSPKIVEMLDYKIYIDCHEDLRFQRRLKRDIEQRGRTPDGVHNQFYKQVKPMHDKFVEPSQAHACDIVNLDNFDDKLNYWCEKIKKA